jgi:cytochrome c
MKKVELAALAAVVLFYGQMTAAAPTAADNPEMVALAKQSGCLTCHAITASKPAAGAAKPIGPAWQDVARKYKNQQHAAAKLTDTVMQGSSPYASHWQGKVTGLAMPPNAVAINRDQARTLVRWILTLDQ